MTDVTTKQGKEAPPRLFDLTSLQVECNKKFSYSAENTLKIIQSLYEKKVTTYPRVDTTFLSDDIYPKVPGILAALTDYQTLTAPFKTGKIPKSKKVFDNAKVTDHHAIIPTNVKAVNLTAEERKVYDLVARRFIAAFYPDCLIANTTVLGDVNQIEFKATGKQILSPGWRAVFGKEEENNDESENTLPAFTQGESGPHTPALAEKWTQPPKPYTEATLLRAMETAGKMVDDEELRDALKENGIGRPSTRAAIIETLFKRHYIRKERKNLIATQTGIELIGTIRDELLKSAELTGIWENKLRKIERNEYRAADFLEELKKMVSEIVLHVLSDNSGRITAAEPQPEATKKKAAKPATAAKPRKKRTAKSTDSTTATKTSDTPTLPPTEKQPLICPLCHSGEVIQGKTAYGCSRWREGCTFRLPFDQPGIPLDEATLRQRIQNYTPNSNTNQNE